VLYVINDLSVGGAEMMLYKLLAVTDRARFAPIVVSLITEGAALRERIEALGITVYTLGMTPGRPTPVSLWRLVRLLRQVRPALIFGWMYHSCLAAQVAGALACPRTPVLWSIHCAMSSLAAEKRLTAATIRACGWLSRLPARIIFVSRAGQVGHGSLGYHTKRSAVIPNGIDTRRFVPSEDARASLRRELGLDPEAFLIGLAGRYDPDKNHAGFLRAAALLSRTHPATRFVLAGRGIQPDNAALREIIQAADLVDRVHLLGERDDMPRLAAALDLLCLSSTRESCPNVVGEAMACGVPCVVTDVGDAAWLVGDTGRVAAPNDAIALAAACQELIELGPVKRATLGRAARARVSERCSLDGVVERYEALYETVLAEVPRSFAVELPWPRQLEREL
jgi:glycosyltransferase involved in cell wall biosynthesis